MQFTLFQILLIVSGIISLFLFFVWGTYNSLIKLRNQVKSDYSDIDIQLKRRSSLVDNLVNLVKDYAKHENQTFKEVAAARSAIDTSKTAADSAKADNMLTQTLRSLFMVVEKYPELKASDNYRELRTDLLNTENAIASVREAYNHSVQRLNNTIQTFPSLLVANTFGFAPEAYFQAN